MAMMAITTRSSIRVNARRPELGNRSPFAGKNGWFTDCRFTQTRGAVNADWSSDANQKRRVGDRRSAIRCPRWWQYQDAPCGRRAQRKFSEGRIVLEYPEFIRGKGVRRGRRVPPQADLTASLRGVKT